jgi:ribosomal protein S12 methylthiotransferase
VDYKLSGAVQKVVVAGCLSQRLGPELLDQIDGIDAVVGLNQRDNISEIIEKTFSSQPCASPLCQAKAGPRSDRIPDDRARLLITPGHWAYLRISEGCDRRCSFCTIPAIRGRFRSKTPKMVLAEAAELVSAGVVELNLIAQDTTYYGRDLQIENGLSALVGELDATAGLEWIRLMYVYPAGIDEQLIETIAGSERVVRYLDIPMQHVSDDILKSMRRPDTGDGLRRLIENLRCAMPDIVLRTTLMVGFPGETGRQFAELLESPEPPPQTCRPRSPARSNSSVSMSLCWSSNRSPSQRTKAESAAN